MAFGVVLFWFDLVGLMVYWFAGCLWLVCLLLILGVLLC